MAIAATVSAGCQVAAMEKSTFPALVIDDSVAADLHVLAEDTWNAFLAAFPARTDCFGNVHLQVSHALDSRAAYDPQSAKVTIRVPGTPAMLQGALIHEWAHHVEFQCEEHKALRAGFLAAQDFPPGRDWRPDALSAPLSSDDWADIPSEHFAEAAIEHVLGQRPIPTQVRVTGEAVGVIRTWSQGGNAVLPYVKESD